MSRPKRKRSVPLYVWVDEDEYAAIQERMAQAGTQNLSAYIRKMELNGYVLNVDLAPVRELVSCNADVPIILIRLLFMPIPTACINRI
ncbi:plasmid mobilization protein [Bacillus velezensis]